MYRKGHDNARSYTDEQRRRYELWLEDGDGPGHYLKRCLVCEAWFMAAQHNARFCDRRCYNWWWSRPPKECLMCGEEFRRQHHAQAKYCSDRCKGRAHREGLSDPNHPSQRRYHGGSPKNWPPSKIAVYPSY
jgi:hypothetical protein